MMDWALPLVRRLASLSRLPQCERAVLPLAALLVAVARLLPRAGVHRTCRAVRCLARPSPVAPRRMAELVGAASRALPGTTACLPRAIALEALLSRSGHPAELRIGVAPLAGRARLDAHAWVEVGGAPVGEDPSGYTALPLFGTRG